MTLEEFQNFDINSLMASERTKRKLKDLRYKIFNYVWPKKYALNIENNEYIVEMDEVTIGSSPDAAIFVEDFPDFAAKICLVNWETVI